MNPELRDPVNALGVLLVTIGSGMMLYFLVSDMVSDWIPGAGFILWAVGILILFLHSRKKK